MSTTFRLIGVIVLSLSVAVAAFSVTSQPASAGKDDGRNQHQIDVEWPTAQIDLPGDDSAPIDVEPNTAQIDLPNDSTPIDVGPQTAEIDLPDDATPIEAEPKSAELDLPDADDGDKGP